MAVLFNSSWSCVVMVLSLSWTPTKVAELRLTTEVHRFRDCLMTGGGVGPGMLCDRFIFLGNLSTVSLDADIWQLRSPWKLLSERNEGQLAYDNVLIFGFLKRRARSS